MTGCWLCSGCHLGLKLFGYSVISLGILFCFLKYPEGTNKNTIFIRGLRRLQYCLFNMEVKGVTLRGLQKSATGCFGFMLQLVARCLVVTFGLASCFAESDPDTP